MWFRALLTSLRRQSFSQATRPSNRAPGRRHEARRLFLEGLEDRSLMAFSVLANYATLTNPQDMQLTHIDGNSTLDMVVLNSDAISVRLGNADGTFGPLHHTAAGNGDRDMVAGDFTGDGLADIVVGDLALAGLGLLRGNGDGTFGARTDIPLPEAPGLDRQLTLSLATGDLNADGKLDLVVGGEAAGSVCGYYGYYGSYYICTTVEYGFVNVLLGNGAGGFTPGDVKELGTSDLPYSAVVGDVNNDGHADVLTASNRISTLLGDGSGAVADPIVSGAGAQLNSLSLGDVDGDGNADTLLSSGGNALQVQKGDGQGHFSPQTPLPIGSWPNSAVIGDANADGKLDLVAAGVVSNFICTLGDSSFCLQGYNTITPQAAVLLGDGVGGFAAPQISQLGGPNLSGYLPGVALADLTGDGLPELAVDDYSQNNVIVATPSAVPPQQPALAISDASIVEGYSGNSNALFIVTLAGAHSGSVSVKYATANNTAAAGSDYTAKSGTLTFGPGESTKTISIPVQGDTIDEEDEQFFVNLSSAVGAQISDARGIATILDDDDAPLIKIGDVSKQEGNQGSTSFTFTVSLSAASGRQVSVNYATADGTATVTGNDYVAASGTIVFAPGQTTAKITIQVRGDQAKEANETFLVNLSSPSHAALYDGRGVGTITNDDGSTSGRKQNLSSIDLGYLLLADDASTPPGKRK